jgi:Kef-type K+ transport system membrane component KefB
MRLLQRRAVVTAIGGTLITDTLALVVLVVVLQLAANNGTADPGPWWLPIGLLAVLAATSWRLVPWGSSRFLARRNLRRAEKALFVLATVLLLSSVAQVIGTEKILGAFLAGLCLNRLLKEQQPELLEHLEFVGRMLFIPFFFLETGMRLELEVFTGAPTIWGLAALLLLLVLAGKAAASWLTGHLYAYSRASRALMIGLTTPQAAATLAVTVSASQAGLFGEEVVDAVILVIFITCLLGPLLTRFSGNRLEEIPGAEETEDGRQPPPVAPR